ncbi:MAG: hypothetical protein ABIG95_02895 [Candidatus Woesearchaeota archaeon]
MDNVRLAGKANFGYVEGNPKDHTDSRKYFWNAIRWQTGYFEVGSNALRFRRY